MQGVLFRLGWENIVPTFQHTIYYCSELFLRKVYAQVLSLILVLYIEIYVLWLVTSYIIYCEIVYNVKWLLIDLGPL